MVGTLGRVDHFLEDRPILVERRGAGLGEDLDDLDVLPFAPPTALGDLIGQRQVALGLAGGGHAGVDGGSGHEASSNRIVFISCERKARNRAISSCAMGSIDGKSEITVMSLFAAMRSGLPGTHGAVHAFRRCN